MPWPHITAAFLGFGIGVGAHWALPTETPVPPEKPMLGISDAKGNPLWVLTDKCRCFKFGTCQQIKDSLAETWREIEEEPSPIIEIEE